MWGWKAKQTNKIQKQTTKKPTHETFKMGLKVQQFILIVTHSLWGCVDLKGVFSYANKDIVLNFEFEFNKGYFALKMPSSEKQIFIRIFTGNIKKLVIYPCKLFWANCC